jgi:hypothetical protein
MRRRLPSWWPLLAPAATVLLRLPFVLTRAGLFGSDPYLHLRLARAWSAASAWPALLDGHPTTYLDYEAWPGAHALAAAAMELGADPVAFMQWAPLLAVFVLDLALVLAIARWADAHVAVAGGLLFALADHLFFQTQWYTPEVVCLPMLGALVLNELVVRKRALGPLLLTAMMVTHHLTFLVGVLLWMLLTPREPRRWFLASVAYVLGASAAFWGAMPAWVGSVNDMRAALWDLNPGVIVAAAVLGMLGLRLAMDAVIDLIHGRLGERPLLELLPGRWRRAGLAALVAAAAVAAAALVLLYRPPEGNEGIVVQPAKLLVLAGGVLFIALVGADRRRLGLASAFGALVLLLLLNPVLFDFATIGIRFLEFVYVPGFVVLALGAFALRERWPRRATAVLVAMLLAAPVLLADDVVRYDSEGARRFRFSETDLDFASQVAAVTEGSATILAPFGLSAMLDGLTGRNTSTWSIGWALEAMSYVAIADKLVWLADSTDHPVYVVHTEERVRYIEEAGDRVTQRQVDLLGESVAHVPGILEPVIAFGPHSLYRVPRAAP